MLPNTEHAPVHIADVIVAIGKLRKAKMDTRAPIVQLDGERPGGARAVRSFTGELVGASEEEVTLAADGGIIAIPYSEISRSNLIAD